MLKCAKQFKRDVQKRKIIKKVARIPDASFETTFDFLKNQDCSVLLTDHDRSMLSGFEIDLMFYVSENAEHLTKDAVSDLEEYYRLTQLFLAMSNIDVLAPAHVHLIESEKKRLLPNFSGQKLVLNF